MPKIDSFAGLFPSLFVPIATLSIGMFVWLRADIAVVRAAQSEHGERLARIEGAVAGALGRPFPERPAQVPEAADG